MAAVGIQTYAPDVAPLTWETFVDPVSWWMIPDETGEGYKAELTLRNDGERTIRLNNWFLPDLRGGEVSRPHSHPWWFEARVLAGGYTEDRYERLGDHVAGAPSVREQLGVEHRAGGRNEVPLSVYHEVTEIHEPGRTLSLMVCGRSEKVAWGYLDTASGCHMPVLRDPAEREQFRMRLYRLNPQHAWVRGSH